MVAGRRVWGGWRKCGLVALLGAWHCGPEAVARADADGSEARATGASWPALTLDSADVAVAASQPATPADKSTYTLFNPTPATLLRDFNTDRPDVTESPYTVDAGHYQPEFSFVEYTRDDERGSHTDGLSVLPANFRVGLLNNVEADVMVNPYENILLHGKGVSARASGFGDMEFRAKVNFWGNDGGTTAGGIIPFVSVPTGQDGLSTHHVEGGVILPLAVELPAGFDLGTQAEFDFSRNADNNGYGTNFVHTLTIGHDIVEKLSAYVEYVGVSPIGTGQTYLAYFDTGLVYLLSTNIEVDVGVNLGISDHAEDYTFFSGMSFRY